MFENKIVKCLIRGLVHKLCIHFIVTLMRFYNVCLFYMQQIYQKTNNFTQLNLNIGEKRANNIKTNLRSVNSTF